MHLLTYIIRLNVLVTLNKQSNFSVRRLTAEQTSSKFQLKKVRMEKEKKRSQICIPSSLRVAYNLLPFPSPQQTTCEVLGLKEL